MLSSKITTRKTREQAEVSKSAMLSCPGETLLEFSPKSSCLTVIPINLKSNIFACEENDDFVFPSL